MTRSCRGIVAVVIAASFACKAAPSAQPQPEPTSKLDVALHALGEDLDRKLKELHIPGASLVIVKGQDVVYLRGHGVRSPSSEPVTESTLFAIGSTTKAFTGLLAVMAEEEGKISLTASPKTCVPYFKLKDAAADKSITIRDLLTHTSGLMRTDIAWYTGKLTAEEVIRVAANAEATAKLGEKFQYQNVMYAVAGECLARIYDTSFAAVLRSRIFAPLGMATANTSASEAAKSSDVSTGYRMSGEPKRPVPVAMRNIDHVAAAGAINASATDLGQWLRFLLAKGEWQGSRLVSKDGFAKLTQSYIADGDGGYGLGWGLSKWRGHAMIHHAGGIDGFRAHVALLPDRQVGFALLVNAEVNELAPHVTDKVFELFEPEREDKPAAATSESEAATYGVIGGITAEVKWHDDKLRLHVIGQKLTLESDGGRRYRIAGAPASYSVLFEGAGDDAKMVLRQPGMTMRLPRLTEAMRAANKDYQASPELLELRGFYQVGGAQIEINFSDKRVAVFAPRQPPMPLEPAGKDRFAVTGFDGFVLSAERKDGKIVKLTLAQPGKSQVLVRVGEPRDQSITLEELRKRAAAAHGHAALAKRKSWAVAGELSVVHQGLLGEFREVRATGNRFSNHLKLTALDKDIASIDVRFDGDTARTRVSFTSHHEDMTSGEQDGVRMQARWNPFSDWKTGFKDVRIARSSKVAGEDVFVVAFETQHNVKWREYYSQKTFLLLKQDIAIPGAPLRSIRFSDYRKVKGLSVAHQIVIRNELGKVVMTVKDVSFDVENKPQDFAF